jgi:hypothetical protein
LVVGFKNGDGEEKEAEEVEWFRRNYGCGEKEKGKRGNGAQKLKRKKK